MALVTIYPWTTYSLFMAYM